jgi:predicted nuclease of predicted toxin-antitoxin system
MRGLLLDQGLPRSTTTFLIKCGFDALHASEAGLSKASDSQILDYARERDLIVVTLDADFHMLLAASGAASPSVIRLRRQRLNAEQAALAIREVLDRGREMLEGGAVASASKTLVRFKRLPFQRPK